MPTLEIGPNQGLYYEHVPPPDSEGGTFVFFNALTSDTSAWEAAIAPRLRAAGHGSLLYNLRGQTDSPFARDDHFGLDFIVNDALALLEAVGPVRPIFVGLSIGGLFAANAYLRGASAAGLVLINTLRTAGARLQWIGDALVRAVEVGGLDLFRDLFLPLLMNQDWLAAQRPNFLKPDPNYIPLAADSGHYKLLAEVGTEADWDLPYEQLALPTLVITGLQDHVFLEPAVVDTLFARLPQGRRVDLPDAGHLIPAERPEVLAEALITFAKEV